MMGDNQALKALQLKARQLNRDGMPIAVTLGALHEFFRSPLPSN